MGKYNRAAQAADENAHSYFTLGTEDYNQTLRTFNTYRFSTTTMDVRTRLNVPFIPTMSVLYYLIWV